MVWDLMMTMLVPLVISAVVIVISMAADKITYNKGALEILPGMTIDTFTQHVVGFLLDEKFQIHPYNPDEEHLYRARLLVTDIGAGLYDFRITGDEIQEDGHVVCRNSSRIFYSVNESHAIFMSLEGNTRLVVDSGEPRRSIAVFTCYNWKEGMVECPGKDAYINLFDHRNDDIEYYEYDDDNDNETTNDNDDNVNRNGDNDAADDLDNDNNNGNNIGNNMDNNRDNNDDDNTGDWIKLLGISSKRRELWRALDSITPIHSVLRQVITSGYTDKVNETCAYDDDDYFYEL